MNEHARLLASEEPFLPLPRLGDEVLLAVSCANPRGFGCVDEIRVRVADIDGARCFGEVLHKPTHICMDAL